MDWFELKNIIPLLIPIVGMLIPIIAIVMGIASKMQREKLRHETLRAFAERGQPVPPELLADAPVLPRGARTIGPQAAAINIGVGLGLALMFYMMRPDSWLWTIGCIPLFVGVALLIAGLAERRQPQP
jgi:hypothetical protein